MIWLGFSLLALAQDDLPDLWVQMHEGRLVHLIEGNPVEAQEIFQALLKDLPNQHPLYGHLRYSLGCAQYDVKQIDLAKENLIQAIQSPSAPPEAISIYMDILAEENQNNIDSNKWVFSPSEYPKSPYEKLLLSEPQFLLKELQFEIQSAQEGELEVVWIAWNSRRFSQRIVYPSGRHMIRVYRKTLSPLLSLKTPIRSLEIHSNQRITPLNTQIR